MRNFAADLFGWVQPLKTAGENSIFQKNMSDYRSEGFPRTGYFVPGRDGVEVGQDSRILLALSLTNIRRFYDR